MRQRKQSKKIHEEDNHNGFEVMENVTADVYQQWWLKCKNIKLQFIESNWSVTTKSGNCELVGLVKQDSIQLESPSNESSSIGIRNINWEKCNLLQAKNKVTKSEISQPYLDLFLTLWPGDWKKQLIQFNKVIESKYNTKSKNKVGVCRSKKVTKKIFFIIFHIIIFFGAIGKGGKLLFEKEGVAINLSQPFHGPKAILGYLNIFSKGICRSWQEK